jgi:hypothetical protein
MIHRYLNYLSVSYLSHWHQSRGTMVLHTKGREQRRWLLASPIRAWQSFWQDTHMNSEGCLAVWSEVSFSVSCLRISEQRTSQIELHLPNSLSPDCSIWGLGFPFVGIDICGPRVSLTSVWSINIYIIYISIVSIYLSIYPSILSIYLIYLHHIDLSMLSIDLSYWSIHLSYMSIYLSYLSIVSIYRIYLSYLSILSNILSIYLSIV